MKRTMNTGMFAVLALATSLEMAQAQDCLPPNVEGAKLICNAQDLMALSNTDPKQVFQLGADIDLKGINYYPPDLEAGTLDFRKFSVRNLTLNQPSGSFLGLIGTNSGLIKNAKVYAVNLAGLNSVGGLVGINVGRIEWAQVSGTISGHSDVGGIAGTNLGSIRDASLKDSSIVGDAESSAIGGIVGSDIQLSGAYPGSLLNVHFNGTVSGASSAGGIAGRMEGGQLTTATIQGATIVSASRNAGGIVGSTKAAQAQRSIISQVISTSTGRVEGVDNVGGLIGDADAVILSQSFAAAKVNGVNKVGGLIGRNSGNVHDCFTTGAVSGYRRVGGVVGEHTNPNTAIANTYATGVVKGYIEKRGLVGRLAPGAKLLSSYWNITANKNLQRDGNERTNAQLHQQATFKGFNFKYMWFMPPYFTPQLLVFK